ncbi:MAG: histone deacetylase [Planctomycetes bacterium]|nr:histone deacetylase [Planctomycetota bacterium]
MARTGFVSSALFLRHDTGPGHPERAARLVALDRRLAQSGLVEELERLEAQPCDPEFLALAHDRRHVESVARAIHAGARVLDEGDTRVSADSFRAASAAAGGAISAVEKVLAGEWRRAFVAARPPGHHAERALAMGFCLFNNVAIAARYAQRFLGLERVAILDFDVHHGNGTQHIFEEDASVFYASLHQYPLYPGTGAAGERGKGMGAGTTRNCPQAPGAGDAQWISALEDFVLPEFEQFKPQLLLLSAGFDAHERDPLAQTKLTTDAYRRITQMCTQFADAHCQGRVVSLLEGGYDLDALAESVEAHVQSLARP